MSVFQNKHWTCYFPLSWDVLIKSIWWSLIYLIFCYFPLSWDVLIKWCWSYVNIVNLPKSYFPLSWDVLIKSIEKCLVWWTLVVISRYLGMFSLNDTEVTENEAPAKVISRYLGMFSLNTDEDGYFDSKRRLFPVILGCSH